MILFLIILSSCQKKLELPKDFSFEYKTYWISINTLDTLYFKRYENRDTILKLSLTEDEMYKIFYKMNEIDIFNYPKTVCLPSNVFVQEPNRHLKITSNNNIYEINWSYPSIDKKAKNLDNLIEFIENSTTR